MSYTYDITLHNDLLKNPVCLYGYLTKPLDITEKLHVLILQH